MPESSRNLKLLTQSEAVDQAHVLCICKSEDNWNVVSEGGEY